MESKISAQKLAFLNLNDKQNNAMLTSVGMSMVIIVVCFILILKVIVPQFNGWLEMNQQVKAAKDRIENLKYNVNFMEKLDKAKLDADYQVISSAYPADKDFAGILNSISVSAIKSGVPLDNFYFTIGNLSTASAQLKESQPLTVSLILKSDVSGVDNFVKEIESKVPISKVFSLDGSTGSVTTIVQFFAKPFPKFDASKDTTIIEPLTNGSTALIKELYDWQATSIGSEDVSALLNASPSAEISEPPF
jgi:Tfp pilus assembly protein PilO